MRFEHLLSVVADEPAFETGLLLAGDQDPGDVRRQLSRWDKSGRLLQLRRGLYTLAPPYQKIRPHPFLIANQIQPGSYVSCQSALAYHGLIPEHVPVVTSVGHCRPRRRDTPIGRFEYRHLKRDWIRGFRWCEVSPGQCAYVATPEKALLDLIYLEPGADRSEYVEQLRLQNLENLDLAQLRRFAEEAKSPKLRRASQQIVDKAKAEQADYEIL